MELKAVRDSAIIADLFVVEKTLIHTPNLEGLSLFGYLIDIDVPNWVGWAKDIHGGQYVLRQAWKGDIFPEGINPEMILSDKLDEEGALIQTDKFYVLPGDYVRKVKPWHIIAVFDTLDEMVDFIDKYIFYEE